MLEKLEGSGDNLKYAFTPAKSQGECCPKVLFEQDKQSHYPRQDSYRFLPESRDNQPRQSKHYPIPRQEYPSQRIRDQLEMDTRAFLNR